VGALAGGCEVDAEVLRLNSVTEVGGDCGRADRTRQRRHPGSRVAEVAAGYEELGMIEGRDLEAYALVGERLQERDQRGLLLNTRFRLVANLYRAGPGTRWAASRGFRDHSTAVHSWRVGGVWVQAMPSVTPLAR
jgi:hypothetical protein